MGLTRGHKQASPLTRGSAPEVKLSLAGVSKCGRGSVISGGSRGPYISSSDEGEGDSFSVLSPPHKQKGVRRLLIILMPLGDYSEGALSLSPSPLRHTPAIRNSCRSECFSAKAFMNILNDVSLWHEVVITLWFTLAHSDG